MRLPQRPDNGTRPKLLSASCESSVMTLAEAAKYLRVSKAHLSNVIRGKVDGVPPLRYAAAGRRVLLRREWVDAWLETLGRQMV
jgi:excisionase family DNA binding protein